MREFPKAGLKVITGCTKHPAYNSKYCKEHCSEESPAVTASSISSRTRQQLRKYRTDTALYAEAEQDEVYIVESIMEIKAKQVLVKWVGFPDPTWENENGIPKFIRNYYEKNPGKLGKALPNPKINIPRKLEKALFTNCHGGMSQEQNGSVMTSSNSWMTKEKYWNQLYLQAAIPESPETNDRMCIVLGCSQGHTHVGL